jgi:sulfur carrier protein ThiS adenylyltransferase
MTRIGIAGCGGIGSNIAVHLVRSGVLKLKLVDFDKIDISNLNRQFYFYDQAGLGKAETLEKNLRRINPAVELEVESKLLTKDNITETFSGCGIVVEGFDRADCKAMFHEALSESGKFVVSACGLAGLDTDQISVKKVGKNGFIVGDFVSDIKDKKLYSPKIFIVASIMANLILKELGFKDE